MSRRGSAVRRKRARRAILLSQRGRLRGARAIKSFFSCGGGVTYERVSDEYAPFASDTS